MSVASDNFFQGVSNFFSNNGKMGLPTVLGDLAEDVFGWENSFSSAGKERAAATAAFERNKELLQLEQTFNSAEAQKNRDWEQMMSSTAHQREVKDLIAAGLNPILAVNQGASSPTSAPASLNSHSTPKADISKLGRTSIQYFKLVAELANSAANVAKAAKGG